jgi:hypothetical protein
MHTVGPYHKPSTVWRIPACSQMAHIISGSVEGCSFCLPCCTPHADMNATLVTVGNMLVEWNRMALHCSCTYVSQGYGAPSTNSQSHG